MEAQQTRLQEANSLILSAKPAQSVIIFRVVACFSSIDSDSLPFRAARVLQAFVFDSPAFVVVATRGIGSHRACFAFSRCMGYHFAPLQTFQRILSIVRQCIAKKRAPKAKQPKQPKPPRQPKQQQENDHSSPKRTRTIAATATDAEPKEDAPLLLPSSKKRRFVLDDSDLRV